jgi:non-lysosomal glucosylceramidase
LKAGKTYDVYWNGEDNEVKYQIGDGCVIDQILPQWHAHLYGLGEIYDPIQTRKAAEALYKYNFIRQRDVYNPCRIYSLNDEKGMVICTWPESHYKPIIPVPYSQETMHGFEYSSAMQMMQYGLVEEGLEVVEALRERYDGNKRNPWNEIECGNNYARSMSSYALLNTLSGFSFDMVNGMIGFDPIIHTGESFQCFWSLDSGWGEYVQTEAKVELRVLYGNLRLKTFQLPTNMNNAIESVSVNGQSITFQEENGMIVFSDWVTIQTNQSLTVSY